MAFDLASAKPVTEEAPAESKFDLASARPVEDVPAAPEKSKPSLMSDDPKEVRAALDSLADSASKPIIGGAEDLAHLVTGALATPVSGFAGMGAGALNMVTDALGAKRLAPDAADVVNKVGQTLTYQPQTESGKAGEALAAVPFQKLAEGGKKLGDVVQDRTGSPTLAAAADTAVNALPMVLDPAVRGMMAPEAAAEAAAAAPKVAPKNMTPEQLKEANRQALLQENVPLDQAQRGSELGAKAKRASDMMFGESPFTAEQRQAFVEAALKKAGFKDAKNATPDAMEEMKNGIDADYQDLTGRVPTKVDKAFVDRLNDLSGEVERSASADAAGPLLKQIEHLKNLGQSSQEGVFINGRAAQNARAELGRMQGSQNSDIRHFAGEIKNALDDAFERGAKPEDVEKMQDVRQRFGRLEDISRAVAGDPNGQFSPQKLVQVLSTKRNKGRMVYGFGDSDLEDFAKAAKDILPDKVGNSGTPKRISDVGFIAHPVKAAQVAGAAVLGRALNERGAYEGTPQALAQKRIAESLQKPPGTESLVLPTAVSAQTPEEQRRRFLIDALRNNP